MMSRKVFFHSRKKVAKWMELYLIWSVLFLLGSPLFYFYGFNREDKTIVNSILIPSSYESFEKDLAYIHKNESYQEQEILIYLKKKAKDNQFTIHPLSSEICKSMANKNTFQPFHIKTKNKLKNLIIYLPISGKKYLNLLTIPLMNIASDSGIDFIFYPENCYHQMKYYSGYRASIFIRPLSKTDVKIAPKFQIYGIHGLSSSLHWTYWFPELKKNLKGKINYMLKDSFFSHRKDLISYAFTKGIPSITFIVDEEKNQWYSTLNSSQKIAARIQYFGKKLQNQKEDKNEMLKKLKNSSFWIQENLSLSNWGKWYIGIFLFILSFIPLINGFAIRNESFNPIMASIKAIIYSSFSLSLYFLIILSIKMQIESIFMIPITLFIVLIFFIAIRRKIRNFMNMQDNVISNMVVLNFILIILAFYQPLQYLLFLSIALGIFQLKMRSVLSFLVVVIFFISPLIYLLGNPIYLFLSQIHSLSIFSDLFFPNNVSIFFFVLISGFFISMIDTNEKKR